MNGNGHAQQAAQRQYGADTKRSHTVLQLGWAWALLAAYALELGLGGALVLWAAFAAIGAASAKFR